MSFKVQVQPSGHEFTTEGNESILDAALRHGLAFPYGCRGGACGACKGKLISGEISYDDNEPMAITEDEMADRQVLFCVARPTSDVVMEIKEVGAVEEIPVKRINAKVVRMGRLNDEVMDLYLELPPEERLQFLAGQYMEFEMSDGRKRAFSIANAPHDDKFLEFHIRHISGGAFTDHVFSDMQEGEVIPIEGPHGSFYMREDSERPMIMVATGTGFGPIKGLIEHAIAEQSTRPIYLYWGARDEDGLYLDELARGWDAKYNNIHYRPVLSRAAEAWSGRRGYVQEAVMADFDDLSDYELYACGHPDMVYSAKDALVSKGISPDNCFSDAFSWAKD